MHLIVSKSYDHVNGTVNNDDTQTTNFYGGPYVQKNTHLQHYSNTRRQIYIKLTGNKPSAKENTASRTKQARVKFIFELVLNSILEQNLQRTMVRLQ